MKGDELKAERSGLRLAFHLSPVLSSYFELNTIEEECSPDKVESKYGSMIRSSQAVVLLLGQTLRPAVVDEWHIARSANIPVFAFIKDRVSKSTEMTQFITNELYPAVTPGRFHELDDLFSKVSNELRRALVSPLLTKEAARQNSEMQSVMKGVPENDERVLRLLSGITFSDRSEVTRHDALRSIVQGLMLSRESGLSKHDITETVLRFLPGGADRLREPTNVVIDKMFLDGDLVAVGGDAAKLRLSRGLAESLGQRVSKQVAPQESALADFHRSIKWNEQPPPPYADFRDTLKRVVIEVIRLDAFGLARHILNQRPRGCPDSS
jgi:hypothetical protein